MYDANMYMYDYNSMRCLYLGYKRLYSRGEQLYC